MVRKTVAEFKVEYLQVMDENGKVEDTLMPKLSSKQVKEFYYWMVLTRAFDEKALKLQRTGRLGTYGSPRGQEASIVGTCGALEANDFIFPTYREHSVWIMRGTPLDGIFQAWSGDERAQAAEGVNNFTVAVPLGTQALHATGYAYAIKYRKENRVAMTYFGDGTSSTGATQIAMNFGGVWQAPIVYICQNNQYAISTPRSIQTHAQTIAQKAIAYGFPGIQVDGNDLFAVYAATKEAVDRARQGKGPSLIECLTYRISDHTTADDWKKYRSKEEVDSWIAKDPIDRLKKFMHQTGMQSTQESEKIAEECIAKVEEAVKKFEAVPKPKPSEMFDFIYEKMPKHLKEDKEYFEKLMQERGEM